MTRVQAIAAGQVAALRCPYCGRVPRADHAGIAQAQDLWRVAGVVAVGEDQIIGGIVVWPAPDDPSVAVIGSAWVAEGATRCGVGRRLVQTLAGALIHRGVSSLQAVSGRPTCTELPALWLLATGFVPSTTPHTWRLELSQTVTTKRTLKASLARWLPDVRPVPGPEPVGRVPE